MIRERCFRWPGLRAGGEPIGVKSSRQGRGVERPWRTGGPGILNHRANAPDHDLAPNRVQAARSRARRCLIRDASARDSFRAGSRAVRTGNRLATGDFHLRTATSLPPRSLVRPSPFLSLLALRGIGLRAVKPLYRSQPGNLAETESPAPEIAASEQPAPAGVGGFGAGSRPKP